MAVISILKVHLYRRVIVLSLCFINKTQKSLIYLKKHPVYWKRHTLKVKLKSHTVFANYMRRVFSTLEVLHEQ